MNTAAVAPAPNDPEIRKAFEEFRAAYPRWLPGETSAARDAFREACGRVARPDLLVAAAALFAARVKQAGVELRFIPNPGHWLRERRYEDYALGAAPLPNSPKDWTPEQVRRYQETYLTLMRELSSGAEAPRAASRDEILDAARREFSSGGGRPGSPAEEPTVRAALRALGRTLRLALRRAFRSGDRSASGPRPV